MPLVLPQSVELCSVCNGWGAYIRSFREGNFTGWCDGCKGAQFVYASDGPPVPDSVRRQIKADNPGLQWHRQYALGALKPVLIWSNTPINPLTDEPAPINRFFCSELPDWSPALNLRVDGCCKLAAEFVKPSLPPSKQHPLATPQKDGDHA